MARLIIELAPTDTGKILADFTWDFCKKISDNTVVATAGSALTELGFGQYILDNPNVTVDTAFRVHLTADGNKYASGIFSPTDGDLARQSTLVAVPTNPLLSDDARLSNLDATISSRSTYAGGAVASVTAPVSLVAGYDAAKTAAQEATLNQGVADVLTAVLTRLAAAAYTAPDNASIAAALAAVQDGVTGLGALHTGIAAIPTTPVLAADPRLDNLDVPVSSLADGLTVGVDLAPVTSRLDDAVSGLAAIRTAVGDGNLTAADVWAYGERALTDKEGFAPSVADIEGSPVLAKQATLQALADIADPMSVIVAGSDPPITRGEALDKLYIPSYEGAVFVMPVMEDPDLQFVHFYETRGDKGASIGRRIEASPMENQFLHQYVIDKQKLTTLTDENGYAFLALIRGLRYSVKVAGWGELVIEVDQFDNKTFAEYVKQMYDTGTTPPAGAVVDTVEEL